MRAIPLGAVQDLTRQWRGIVHMHRAIQARLRAAMSVYLQRTVRQINQDGVRKLLRRKTALANENAWLINVLTVKYPDEVSHASSFYIGLRVHAIGLRVHAVKVTLQVSALYLAPKAEMEIPTVWDAVVFV